MLKIFLDVRMPNASVPNYTLTQTKRSLMHPYPYMSFISCMFYNSQLRG